MLSAGPFRGRGARLATPWLIVVLSATCALARASQEANERALALSQLEDQLLVFVNGARVSAHLPELRSDPTLRAAARAHSAKMAREHDVGHDFPGYPSLATRIADAGWFFNMVAENVAGAKDPLMEVVHGALMNSPGHRANILSNEVDHVGIGIVLAADRYYVTQEFGGKLEPRPAGDLESEISARLEARLDRPVAIDPAASESLSAMCRQRAADYLKDQPGTAFPPSFGAGLILTLDFIDPDLATTRVLEVVGTQKPLFWILGAAFGRSAKNPGGEYAISVAVFPDLRPKGGSPEDALLQTVNEVRKTRNLPPLRPAADLQKAAAQCAGDRLHDRNRLRTTKGRLTLAYDTASLRELPGWASDQLVAHDLRNVGIHVAYPLAMGIPENRLIVVIVAD